MKYLKRISILFTVFVFGFVATQAQAGLISFWPGEGDALDNAGNNDGTLVDDVTFSAGRIGQAFSFDGAGDFVEVSDDVSLDITTSLSILAWIKPQSVTSVRIIDKITAGVGDGYLLDVLSGKLRFIVGNTLVLSTSNLSLNEFSHVAGVFDGANIKVYVNGVLEGTQPIGIPLPTNNLSLRIGADSNGNNEFGGLIDEVKIFDVPLTANDIAARAQPSHVFISHIVPTNTQGTQDNFAGALGMDFDVNSTIFVTRLGVFDHNSDGLLVSITAHLYDRTATGSPLRTLVFSPGDPGTLVNGSRFKDLATVLELPAGFEGTIVAEGYGSLEKNGNILGARPWFTSDGGGAITFVGQSRFGIPAGSYPATLGGGAADRYAAGTFQFGPTLVNPSDTVVVPTLTEWGIFSLILILAGAAFFHVRKLQAAPGSATKR